MRLRSEPLLQFAKPCAIVVIAVVALLLGSPRPAALAANMTATIQDDSFGPSSFSPNPLTISVGDSVTWKNNGPAVHTVTSDAGQATSFDSGNIAVGATFDQVFSQAGTFKYHCTIHAGMTGSVIVQAAPASGAAT